MLKITAESVQKAHDIVASTPVRAAGYRLKVYPLPVDTGLKAGEREKFSELAKLGFTASTEDQAERETKGADMGIIVDVGDGAWLDPRLGGIQWAKVGQVVKYQRYSGHEFQDPPGSGQTYRLLNDEDIIGFYEEVIK